MIQVGYLTSVGYVEWSIQPRTMLTVTVLFTVTSAMELFPRTPGAFINVIQHQHFIVHPVRTVHPRSRKSPGILKQGIAPIKSRSNVIQRIVKCLS